MAPDVRATGDISSIVGNFYDKKMLERLVANCFIYNLVEKRPLPKGEGTTVYFNRYTNFPTVKTALTEGEVPTISYLSGSSVTATLFQVGGYTALSEVLTLTSFSKVIEETVSNMADTAATSIDNWIVSKCTSTHATDNLMNLYNGDNISISTFFGGKQGGLSTVFISDSGLWLTAFADLYSLISAGANATCESGSYGMDLAKLARITAKLRNSNVSPYADGYYKCVMPSLAIGQLIRQAEWASWNQYTRPEVLDKGEVGRAHGLKIYESNALYQPTGAAISMTSLTGLFTLVFGQGAIGVTELDTEKGVKTYVKAPNTYDTSNPLNQLKGALAGVYRNIFDKLSLNSVKFCFSY